MEEICQQYRSEEIAQYSNNTWFNTFTSVVSNILFVPETIEEHNIELPQEIRYYLVFFIIYILYTLFALQSNKCIINFHLFSKIQVIIVKTIIFELSINKLCNCQIPKFPFFLLWMISYSL